MSSFKIVTFSVRIPILILSALIITLKGPRNWGVKQANEIEGYNYEGIEETRNRKGLMNPVEFLSPERFKSIMKKRVREMERTCNKAWKDPSFLRYVKKGNGGKHLTIPERNFTLCRVAKAASTDWNANLIKLAGKEPQTDRVWRGVNKYAVKGTPPEVMSSKSLVSLIVVRNPFTRLVSGFRDKLERKGGGGWPKFSYFSKMIVDRYRSRAIRELGNEFFMGPNFGAELPFLPPSIRTGNEPSFWEFVKYLIDRDPAKYNQHWKPIFISCRLCSKKYKYNYILKVETRSYEEPVFAKLQNWTEVLGNGSKTIRNSNGYPNMTSEEIARKYFERISLEDKLALYEIYKYDFEFFGYKPDPNILIV